MTVNRWVAGVAACVVLAAASESRAACTISTTGVNFGTYNVFTASHDDSTGTVTIDCASSDRNITVTLSTGQSGNYSSRTMKKGTEALPYNLYRNAARTNIWGSGSSGTSSYSNSNPGNAAITLTVYGRIFAGADVSAGSYTDTVSAVINF